ncbi:leukocyte immunoglobulin-like receptor subfamily B member 3A [Natator depressus]|uniref:leukocyte immunoglobulin-like receptor subfamily B member 3A n=1 Tax=Natator depressus TaxID=27790 RepID=UPI003EB7FC44
MRFVLYKAGYWNHPTRTDPAGSEAEVPIPSARREHGGSYTCRYSYTTGSAGSSQPSDPVQIIVAVSQAEGGSYTCYYPPDSDPNTWVEPSDPVQLVVADPSLPRPSISLSPTGVTAPGANVTIRCQGQRRDVRFFLHKAGDRDPPRDMDPAGDGAEFHIPSVGRQHGGSYSCSYRPPSEPFISSQPSHPVDLVVAAPPYFTYTNIARLGLGAVVLLVLWLILAEAYYSCPRGPQEPDPGADGLTHAELDGQVLQAKPGSPALAHGPAQPSVYAAINGPKTTPQFPNTLSRLQRHYLGRSRFGLEIAEKSSDGKKGAKHITGFLGLQPPAQFLIPLALGPQAQWSSALGCCWLAGRSGVSGEGSLPKPSISVSPGGVIPVGGNVTIRCWHQRLGMRFLLYKDGDRNHLRSQLTQTLHLSEPHWGHRPRGKRHHPVSGAAPGREVLPAQGWRPGPAATQGPCWGRGRVPHPQRGPAARRELQLQLPAPIRALRLLAAQPPRGAGGSRNRVADLAHHRRGERGSRRPPRRPPPRGLRLLQKNPSQKRSRTETQQHLPYGGIKGIGSARPRLRLHQRGERAADPGARPRR